MKNEAEVYVELAKEIAEYGPKYADTVEKILNILEDSKLVERLSKIVTRATGLLSPLGLLFMGALNYAALSSVERCARVFGRYKALELPEELIIELMKQHTWRENHSAVLLATKFQDVLLRVEARNEAKSQKTRRTEDLISKLLKGEAIA